MRDFQSALARDVNKMRGRRGPFWGRRYSAEVILDPEALEKKVVYILANPAASDLTESVHEWPGLSSAPELLKNETRSFRIFDRRGWHAAGRPENKSRFIRSVPFEHAILPTLAHLSPEKRAKKLSELLSTQEAKHAKRRATEDKGVLGRERILAANWWDRPVDTDRSPRPLCHASTEEAHFAYRNHRRQFLASYREASLLFRAGKLNVKFPDGSFRPWLPRPEDAPRRSRPRARAPT
jgi:hypothetical protein